MFLLCFWGFSGCASRAEALSLEYAKAFGRELQSIINKNPRYLWGGSSDESKGLDCSGYLFLAARRAGMPVRRTTAGLMAEGHGGWTGKTVAFEDVDGLDLVFWTFKNSRPNGHVGAGWDAGGKVTHASFRRGVVIDEFKGRLKSAVTKIIRLTLGDKKTD